MILVSGALSLLGVILLALLTAMWFWRQRGSGGQIQLPAAVSAGWLAEFKSSTSDRR